jgi:Ca-activated chloride channel family protein
VQPALFNAGVERLALAFVLDASGSVREHITRQEQAARALLANFPDTPRTAVFHFTAQTQLAASFTTDADTIRRAFAISHRPSQRTAIFDAALTAIRSFDRLPTRELERRIIILVSDGLDTASTISPAAVIAEADTRNIAIYVLHLPLYTPRDGRLAPRPPVKGFRDLARLTGGNYYLIGDARSALNPRLAYDFTPAFNDITADLRSQYVLGFYPPTQAFNASAIPNTEHRIKVELTRPNKRNLRLRQLRQSYTLRQTTSPK